MGTDSTDTLIINVKEGSPHDVQLQAGYKEVQADSQGLVDFVVRLVEFILHLQASKSFRGNFSLKLISRSTVKHQ